jgi:hypothetical protein
MRPSPIRHHFTALNYGGLQPSFPPCTPALHSATLHSSIGGSSPLTSPPFTPALHSRPSLPPSTPALHSRPPLPPFTTALLSRPSLPPFAPALHSRPSPCRSSRFIPPLFTPHPPSTTTLHCAARHSSFRLSLPFTALPFAPALHSSTLQSCPSLRRPPPFTPSPFTAAIQLTLYPAFTPPPCWNWSNTVVRTGYRERVCLCVRER